MIEITFYKNDHGVTPFLQWMNELDKENRLRIQKRLTHIEMGNFGDCKSLGNGVYELRCFFGAGYRVYFGRIDECIIVLLSAGDKGTQERDIKKAKEYWQEFKRKRLH